MNSKVCMFVLSLLFAINEVSAHELQFLGPWSFNFREQYNGHDIEEIVETPDIPGFRGDRPLSFRKIMKFDEQGRLVETVTKVRDIERVVQTATYDEHGNLIEVVNKQNDELQWREHAHYKDGELSEYFRTTHGPEPTTVRHQVTWEPLKDGIRRMIFWYLPDENTRTLSAEFEIDDAGNVLKMSFYDPQSEKPVVVHELDYNQHGHFVRHVRTDHVYRRIHINTFQYQYDQRGNWVERKRIAHRDSYGQRDTEPIHVVTHRHQITYRSGGQDQ